MTSRMNRRIDHLLSKKPEDLSAKEKREVFSVKRRLLREVKVLKQGMTKKQKRILAAYEFVANRKPGVRLINRTQYSTDLLREIVKFSLPSGHQKLRASIVIQNSEKHWDGYAKPFWQKIVIQVPPRSKLEKQMPYRRNGRQRRNLLALGYLPVTLNSPEEVILHLVSHEIRHLWQKHISKVKWGHSRVLKVPHGTVPSRSVADLGNKIHFNRRRDRDADAYAIRKLKQWRSQAV